MMRPSAIANADSQYLRELKRLVAEGEGFHLEFKRKASFPEKIVRELIAFANTNGGSLLIGVDDDGSIPGVKYPYEEIHLVAQALALCCRPELVYQETVLSVSDNRFVVRIDIPQAKSIHYLIHDNKRESFVRVHDMSIKASPEMLEILKRSRKHRDISFRFGVMEKKLMEHLDQYATLTLDQYITLSGLNRFKARRKLILLVLADVLKIRPTEKGDLYSRL